MSQESNVFKSQARRLQKHLAAAFPGFTYSQSLEATAALHGAANWRTLIGEKEAVTPTFHQNMSIPATAPEDDPDQDGVIQENGMSRAEKFLQAEREPHYLVSEGWGHIFGVGMPDSTVRFVFDMVENKIVFMDIMSWKGWVPCGPDQMADVEDSLKNANEEAFSNPEDYGCSMEDGLPDWAKAEAPASAVAASDSGILAKKPRFVFGELEYADLFPDNGNGVDLRFVFDREANVIVALDYINSAQKQWEQAPSIMLQMVQEKFQSENLGGLEYPKAEGLNESNQMPSWARGNVVETASKEGRYVYGEWEHDYNGMGRPSRIRFVFDKEENRLCRLQDKVDGFWEESSPQMFFSVQNIFLGDEDYAIADPEGNDLVESDELPPWAR